MTSFQFSVFTPSGLTSSDPTTVSFNLYSFSTQLNPSNLTTLFQNVDQTFSPGSLISFGNFTSPIGDDAILLTGVTTLSPLINVWQVYNFIGNESVTGVQIRLFPTLFLNSAVNFFESAAGLVPAGRTTATITNNTANGLAVQFYYQLNNVDSLLVRSPVTLGNFTNMLGVPIAAGQTLTLINPMNIGPLINNISNLIDVKTGTTITMNVLSPSGSPPTILAVQSCVGAGGPNSGSTGSTFASSFSFIIGSVSGNNNNNLSLSLTSTGNSIVSANNGSNVAHTAIINLEDSKTASETKTSLTDLTTGMPIIKNLTSRRHKSKKPSIMIGNLIQVDVVDSKDNSISGSATTIFLGGEHLSISHMKAPDNQSLIVSITQGAGVIDCVEECKRICGKSCDSNDPVCQKQTFHNNVPQYYESKYNNIKR